MADRIRRWLDRKAVAESGQIWSLILMPIWFPVLAVLYYGDKLRRKIRAFRILRNVAIWQATRD